MKKYKLFALITIPLLLTGCNSKPDLLKKNVEVEMVSHFGDNPGENNYKDTALYSDYWFIDDTSHGLNYELAVMSAMASGASYSNSLDSTGTKITAFLEDVGYTNIKKNQYYTTGESLEDSMGGIIGSKKIKDYQGKEYTLLALFPRNAGYKMEWMGNFHIGASGIHNGFLQARDELLRFMKNYIADQKITGDLKVWLSGYSRGAATANLLGGYLAEDSGYFGNTVSLKPTDLYVYTIGTPNVIPNGVSKSSVLSVSASRGAGYKDSEGTAYTYTGEGSINPSDSIYKGIHNFIATGDYITKLPPSDYAFTRYGTTDIITYGGDAFVERLKRLSEKTADQFKDGMTYVTELPYKTVDIQKIDIVETADKVSVDALLNSLVAGVVKTDKNREELIKSGFAEVFGDITTIYGVDGPAVLEKIKALNVTELVKAGVFAYLTSALKTIAPETDAKGLAEMVMQVVEMMGKTIADHSTYTDQAFLKDVLDFLINDYQSDEKAQSRVKKLGLLIPAPYGALFTSVLDYAKEKQITATTVDGVLSLLANYVSDHKTDKVVDDLLTALVKLIPETYRSYLSMVTFITGKTHGDITDPDEKNKAIVLDVIEACAHGIMEADGVTVKTSAPEFRYIVLSLVTGFAFKTPSPKILNLITNGATASGGEPIVRDPVALHEIMEEVLALALPKDDEGKLVSVKDYTISAIKDLLDKVKTDKVSKYIDDLKAKVDNLIDLANAFLFDRGNSYSLANDVKKAVTDYYMVQFFFPAHDHELYISYLQTKLPA